MRSVQIGPRCGTLKVNTYRDGIAQKIGHDLVLEVERWNATVAVDPNGAIQAVELGADPRSLAVREGRNGVKPLTDKDREQIRAAIDRKVLCGRQIAFASTAVAPGDGGVKVRGELTLAGTTRPMAVELALGGEGRVEATLSVAQSDWGISPYRALMGALKVRDTVEVVVDVRLPR